MRICCLTPGPRTLTPTQVPPQLHPDPSPTVDRPAQTSTSSAAQTQLKPNLNPERQRKTERQGAPATTDPQCAPSSPSPCLSPSAQTSAPCPAWPASSRTRRAARASWSACWRPRSARCRGWRASWGVDSAMGGSLSSWLGGESFPPGSLFHGLVPRAPRLHPGGGTRVGRGAGNGQDGRVRAGLTGRRFAAKEAAFKAHPTHHLSFHDVVIRSPGKGAGPVTAVIRGAEADFTALVSISHDGGFAVGVCLGCAPAGSEASAKEPGDGDR